MTACIFAGPTLPPRDAARSWSAAWLPPAKLGDVHRAVMLLRPTAIGIVDGYFQWVPSVWHKEILWAMRHGVHVFGAASMGALRAAELAPFGMRGVGRIFEAYRDGALAGCGAEPFEDDDEVAVTHGPPESGYLAASEAMVNIRCTLAAAVDAGVIAAATRERLNAIAKAMFFPARGYEALLRHARDSGVCGSDLTRLEAWLPAGRINQKREDALAMLEAMREFLARDPAPAAPRFEFEHTTLWARAMAQARPVPAHDAADAIALEELRLDAARWSTLRNEALRDLTATAPADPDDGGETLARRLADLRREPDAVERLLDEAARTAAARRMREDLPGAIVERQVLARLRGTEEFSRLATRGAHKRARLAARPGLPHIEEFPELKLLELRDWYFSQVLGSDMPEDLGQFVADGGYEDNTHFHAALFAEYVYRELAGSPATGDTAQP